MNRQAALALLGIVAVGGWAITKDTKPATASPDAPLAAPAELNTSDAAPVVDVASELARLAKIQQAQTVVIAELVAAVDPADTNPEPPKTEQDWCKHCGKIVTWEMRGGKWYCTNGKHFNQTVVVQKKTSPGRAAADCSYSGPVGLFGGRFAPFKRMGNGLRAFGRAVGYGVTHPFGGRFRR